MLKKTLLLLALLLSVQGFTQETSPLKPCPKSPNCKCTLDPKKRKRMDPLPFSGSISESITKLKSIISTIPNTKLVEETETYLHYEFTTNIGNYVDDVEFYFDAENKLIHFRSASREGYGDLGANRRRMRKIAKTWKTAQ